MNPEDMIEVNTIEYKNKEYIIIKEIDLENQHYICAICEDDEQVIFLKSKMIDGEEYIEEVVNDNEKATIANKLLNENNY